MKTETGEKTKPRFSVKNRPKPNRKWNNRTVTTLIYFILLYDQITVSRVCCTASKLRPSSRARSAGTILVLACPDVLETGDYMSILVFCACSDDLGKKTVDCRFLRLITYCPPRGSVIANYCCTMWQPMYLFPDAARMSLLVTGY